MNKSEIKDFLNYRFEDGTLIWPLIRYKFLSENIEDNNTQKNSMSFIKQYKNGIVKIKFSKKAIQFYSSTLFNFKFEGKYINTLDDYYSEIFEKQTIIYEQKEPGRGWRLPRGNRNIATTLDFIELIIKVLGKFYRALVKKDTSDIDTFISFLRQINIEEERIQVTKKDLEYLKYQIGIYRKIYRLFLKLTKPKIIFVNCAHYGGMYSLIVQEAKKMGIKTGEIQHGTINNSHIAYNHDINFINNLEYASYFPEYLLTFGNYWNKQTMIAGKTITVGYEYLNREAQVKNSEIIYDYLFISQWTVTEELVNLACELSNLKKQEQIGFRLHPIEKLTDYQRDKLKKFKIKIILPLESVYSDIKKSKNVVGCYSTSLIEALKFEKNIYYLDNELSKKYMTYGIGKSIKNAEEIISTTEENQNKVKISEIWSDNFNSNYKKFIKEII